MASCVYFCQCSRRTCLALLVPLSAALSCSHGSLLIPLTFIFLSTIFLFTFSQRNPSNSQLKQASPASADCSSCDDDSLAATGAVERAEGGSEEVMLMGMGMSQELLYSESESMDHFSSSEDHSSDRDQRLDFSDGSISDEESDLIEIAIPSGQFVCPDKDLMRWNVKCCKHLCKEAEMNEEEDDNLFEIDINI